MGEWTDAYPNEERDATIAKRDLPALNCGASIGPLVAVHNNREPKEALLCEIVDG